MKYSEIFAQHFSRVVLHALAGDGAEAEIDFAALAAERMLRSGPVTIGAESWKLTVDGQRLHEALSGVPDLTLAAQLIAHSVQSVSFDQYAHSAELRAVAQLLAGAPEPGDEGRQIAGLFQQLGLQSVRLMVGRPSAPIGDAAAAAVETMRKRLVSQRGGDDFTVVRTPPSARARIPTPSGRIPTPPASGTPPTATPVVKSASRYFAMLDVAAGTSQLGRVMDDLTRMAEDAASAQDLQQVADIMYAVVTREASASSPPDRRAYLVGVRHMGKPVLIKAVARLLGRRRDMEEQLMAIIARLGDDAAEVLVDQLAEAENRSERRAVFDALSRLKSGESSLIHALGDSRWYVVRNAAELLGEMQVAGAIGALESLLTHEEERVRHAATSALIRYENVDTTAALTRALDDESSKIRVPAATGLGERTTPRAAAALARRLEVEEDPSVQRALLMALGRNQTVEAARALIEAASPDSRLFKRKGSEYRAAAAAALKMIDSPVALAALKRLKNDLDPAVRDAARDDG